MLITLTIFIVVLIATGIASTYFLDPHRTVARLDIAKYQESPTSFSGNKYVVEGEVAERLAQSPNGVVYALISEKQPLAIVVPQNTLPNFNIEKGQHLIIDIEITKDGYAVATTLSRK